MFSWSECVATATGTDRCNRLQMAVCMAVATRSSFDFVSRVSVVVARRSRVRGGAPAANCVGAKSKISFRRRNGVWRHDRCRDKSPQEPHSRRSGCFLHQLCQRTSSSTTAPAEIQCSRARKNHSRSRNKIRIRPQRPISRDFLTDLQARGQSFACRETHKCLTQCHHLVTL